MLSLRNFGTRIEERGLLSRGLFEGRHGIEDCSSDDRLNAFDIFSSPYYLVCKTSRIMSTVAI